MFEELRFLVEASRRFAEAEETARAVALIFRGIRVPLALPPLPAHLQQWENEGGAVPGVVTFPLPNAYRHCD